MKKLLLVPIILVSFFFAYRKLRTEEVEDDYTINDFI